MLVERKTVGHPGEVVGRDPRGQGVIWPGSKLAPFTR
jgi:hypothetical protein